MGGGHASSMDHFKIGIWVWTASWSSTSPARMKFSPRGRGWRVTSGRSGAIVAESTEPIACSHGLRVIPDVALADLGPVDLFLHPGGQVGRCSRTGRAGASSPARAGARADDEV